ncbi:Fungal Zn2-Cys6 binuclear cluster domain-containing protein [Cladophialophora immunda]|nr:Fungal Zn2-Cys6 binuclear cluster domain-containing protein [Cladophialophora immunda]
METSNSNNFTHIFVSRDPTPDTNGNTMLEDPTTALALPEQSDFGVMPTPRAAGWDFPIDHSWGWANNLSQTQTQTSDESVGWDETFESIFGHITSSDDQCYAPCETTLFSHGGDTIGEGVELTNPAPALSGQQVLSPSGSEPIQKHRMRKQNHSCDPCRLGKRACDLGGDGDRGATLRDGKPNTSCSACISRRLDCTASWLASRQSSQQARKRARTSYHKSGTDKLTGQVSENEKPPAADSTLPSDWLTSSSSEQELVRQHTGNAASAHQFNLYIDAIDVPMTDCLSEGCMPPKFPLGLAILPRLNSNSIISPYIRQAHSWIKDCWNTSTTSWSFPAAAPHLFLAVSILDSLFQQHGNPEHSAGTAARGALFSEVYKWVALATASQFWFERDDAKKSRARDLASATWHKAKTILFQNIAATDSFRLALSLILFGTICPPPPRDGGDDLHTDADFARREGVRRLQKLCIQATTILQHDCQLPRPRRQSGARGLFERQHPVQKLPAEVKEDLLELCGALEWLVVIMNSTAIITSGGRNCPIRPDKCAHDRSCLLMPRLTPKSSETDSTVARRHEEGLNDSIIARAKAEPHTITTMVHRDTTDEIVRHAIGRSGSLVILLYKALALLTYAVEDMQETESSYEDIHRHLRAVTTLVEIWRSTFGTYNVDTTLRIRRSPINVRSLIFHCSGDGDLAVLLFYKLLCRLDAEIANHQTSPARDRLSTTIRSKWTLYQDHRLASATQVSMIASIVSESMTGQEAYIPGIAYHPYPALVVQAHTLAVEAFTDNIQSCMLRMDTKQASEMGSGLNVCLQGLQGLKRSLVNFPNVNNDSEEPGSWHLPYSD